MWLIVPETRSWNFCCLLSRVNKITKNAFLAYCCLSAYIRGWQWMKASSKMKFLLLLRRFSVTMGRKFFRLIKLEDYFRAGVNHKGRPEFGGLIFRTKPYLDPSKPYKCLNKGEKPYKRLDRGPKFRTKPTQTFQNLTNV